MVAKKSQPPAKPAANSAHLSTKLSTASANPANSLRISAFAPAELHLSLFASSVWGLDAHRLRIHDTNTGRLLWEHVFDSGISVNSLSWGTLPLSPENKRKKRKRVSASDDGQGDIPVVAAATNKGNILLFSPSDGKIVKIFDEQHRGSVLDFSFSKGGAKAWSCGVDGYLVQWDLKRGDMTTAFNLPELSARRVASTDSLLLCASHTVYSLEIEDPHSRLDFAASTTKIHSLLLNSDNTHFLSAADTDRYISVFSIAEHKSTHALVAESDVKTLSFFNKSGTCEILAAITIDGVVELFKNPYDPIASVDPRKRVASSRRSDARVKVIRPNSKESVIIANASLQDDELIMAWVEGGVNVAFERIRWTGVEDGEMILKGLVEVEKAKGVVIGAATMNGAKDMGKTLVDQSHAVVIGGCDAQDVDMEDIIAEGYASEDQERIEDSEKEVEEPSFADKMQALEHSAAIKTADATVKKATVAITKEQNQPPSAGSLATVLTQALRTDDVALLESCLHTQNPQSIMNTVRRLNSTLAVELLERLAERISRRPGRAGSLGVWVRSILVAHGGYLVSLPNLMSTLSSLYSALNIRAGVLPKLLELQGRIDMLLSQVVLRQSIRNSADGAGGSNAQSEGVLYVEGKTRDATSDDEDIESDLEPEEVGMEGMQIEDASFIKTGDPDEENESSSSETTNEASESESEVDTEDEDEDDEDAFLDLMASEADAESDESGDKIDYDDADALEDGDSDSDEEVIAGGRSAKITMAKKEGL